MASNLFKLMQIQHPDQISVCSRLCYRPPGQKNLYFTNVMFQYPIMEVEWYADYTLANR